MAVNKDAARKILELVPEEYIKRIPVFVRAHATGKTVEKIAAEHPTSLRLRSRRVPLPARRRSSSAPS
nr:hypothetical protein [uncultured Olsenella sp.]